MPDETIPPANPTPATPIQAAATEPAGATIPAAEAKPAEATSPSSPEGGAAPSSEAKTPEAPAKTVEPPATTTLLGAEKPPEKKDEPSAQEPATAEAAPEAAPEPIVYQAFNLPENFERDEEGMKSFTDVLQEARLSQEAGQKFIDLFVKEAEKMQQRAYDGFKQTVETWGKETEADPEIGGNRLQTALRQAGSVIEQFGTPELREIFNLTGVGNHPAMVRFLSKVGAFIAEGSPLPATKPPAPAKSRAERRYKASA